MSDCCFERGTCPAAVRTAVAERLDATGMSRDREPRTARARLVRGQAFVLRHHLASTRSLILVQRAHVVDGCARDMRRQRPCPRHARSSPTISGWAPQPSHLIASDRRSHADDLRRLMISIVWFMTSARSSRRDRRAGLARRLEALARRLRVVPRGRRERRAHGADPACIGGGAAWRCMRESAGIRGGGAWAATKGASEGGTIARYG